METLKVIQMVITDVDGVLTDGRLYFLPSGEEVKVFDVRDGTAFRLAQAFGIHIVILTGRTGKALEKRVEELGVPAYMGVLKKETLIGKLLKEKGLTREQALFIGDDLMDLPAMDAVGVSACPSDACPEVKEKADLVLSKGGGRGAFRELVELILKAKGLWPPSEMP